MRGAKQRQRSSNPTEVPKQQLSSFHSNFTHSLFLFPRYITAAPQNARARSRAVQLSLVRVHFDFAVQTALSGVGRWFDSAAPVLLSLVRSGYPPHVYMGDVEAAPFQIRYERGPTEEGANETSVVCLRLLFRECATKGATGGETTPSKRRSR